jgi:hypothetical protein
MAATPAALSYSGAMRHWAKDILQGGRVAFLGAVLAAGACTKGPAGDTPAARADESPPSGPAAGPASTSAATPAAAPVLAPEEPAVIASGSNLALASVVRLCTKSAGPGDPFTATVTGAVIGSHGAVIPEGSIVTGHVVDSRDSLTLAFDSLAMGGVDYPISARLVGGPQLVALRGSVRGSGLAALRARGLCVPEHGRMTIQLVADLPIQ